jgi:molybdopterin-guanine dinucleotide biosynthesis protein B
MDAPRRTGGVQSTDKRSTRSSFPPGVSLALQAGGASQRMGADKALMAFVDGTLLEWVRDRVAPAFDQVFIVANEPAKFRHLGLPVVTDALQVRGSAVGIYTAVLASPTDRVLCLACDMPFVTPDLVRRLVEGSAGYDVYVPRHDPYYEPLCAVYAKPVADAYERFLDEGGRRIFSVYSRVNTGYLEVGDGRFGDPGDLFMNVNTPADLEEARRRVLSERASRPAAAAGVAVELSPRIQSFVERSALPVVSVVGKKKSGKTTVLIGVIEELCRRGLRIAVLKHDTHGFDVDIPGTDSYRLREAGAVVTGLSSPEKYMVLSRTTEEVSLELLVARIADPVDLVITEGFKQQDAPKIEISRLERSTGLIAREDELLGIVSDQRFPDYRVVQLDMDDFAGIADLIEGRVLPLYGRVRRTAEPW